MHYCYAPLLHNPQPRPGSYVQSPAWQIGTSYTPPSGLPRRRRGSRAGRSNVSGKGQSREATPSMPFTTTISYVGPRCYRPGRGPGRELPPRRREPCWPFHRVPAPASGACRGERPGRAWSGGRSIYCSPFSPTPPALRAPPPPPAGAVQVISPERPARGVGPRSRPSPVSSHTLDRGGITRGGAGEGTPSPSTKTMLAFPKVPRPGAGAFVVRDREGRGRGNDPDTTFHRDLAIHHSPISPTPGTPGPPQIPLMRAGSETRPSPQTRPKPSPGRLKSAKSGGDPDRGDPAPTRSGFMKIPTIRTFPAGYPDFSAKSKIYRDLHTLAR